MMVQHLEFLVEELSMESFLRAFLPRLLREDRTFQVYSFQGKSDLLGKLDARLRSYARWLPDDWGVVVLVDRDDDDCRQLKQRLDQVGAAAGLRTRSRPRPNPWQLKGQIAIEELEAWYFGEWEAVRIAYPRVSQAIPNNRRFRDPDAIAGGTWEAFERIMQQHGYFKTGLRKVEAARAIGSAIDAERSRSRSFVTFCRAIIEATA